LIIIKKKEEQKDMETQIRELTLLLIYLTAWNEKNRFIKDGILTSWTGYERYIIQSFEDEELLWRSGNNKKLHLTSDGIDEVERLLEKYDFIKRNKIADDYNFGDEND